jgi:Na+-driven multidrug efflux pump
MLGGCLPGSRQRSGVMVSLAVNKRGMALCVGMLLLALGHRALQLWCTTNATAAATVDLAHSYLVVRAAGAPLNSCLLVLQAACRGMGRAGLSLRAALVANVINLALDPLLIFGLRLGVQGAATATVMGQVRSLLPVCLTPARSACPTASALSLPAGMLPGLAFTKQPCP